MVTDTTLCIFRESESGGYGERERERERERDRQTDRQADRQTDRQRDRQTERQRQRERETETERNRDRDRQTERQRDRETDRDRQTETARQPDSQPASQPEGEREKRQTDRQTDSQTDREKTSPLPVPETNNTENDIKWNTCRFIHLSYLYCLHLKTESITWKELDELYSVAVVQYYRCWSVAKNNNKAKFLAIYS